jgi:hypothetical protein
MSKMKCPCCGSLFNEKSFSNQIELLRMSRSKDSLERIEALLTDMNKIRNVEEIDIFYLLNEIKNVEDLIVYRMIDMFKSRGYLEQGYNVKYLVKAWVPSYDFFYNDFNQRVWKAIIKLDKDKKDIDLNTVADTINIVDTDYSPLYEISGFLELVTSPTKSITYVKLLHSDWLRRRLNKQIYNISKNIHDDSTETQVLLEDAHTTIGNIIKLQPNKEFDLTDLLEKTTDSIFKSTTLIKTGIEKLDKVITGMTRGEITIIAGRPGNAKTTVSANIARNLVHDGKRVVMFNREMPNTEMMKKNTEILEII